MGRTLLIVDPQNDFIDDPHVPAMLPVRNSMSDMLALADMIHNYGDRFTRIVVPLDQHPVNHIAHQTMWVDRHGKMPRVFTQITAADVKAGKFRANLPALQPIQAAYVEAVEQTGETLTIWPQHCLIGTYGAAIYQPLWDVLWEWWQPSRDLLLFPKSGNWQTEQYSSFKAAVPVPDDPSTDFRYDILDAITDEEVVCSGEALSHCVSASIMDAIRNSHTIDLVTRMTLLTDCTSNVAGFEKRGDDFLTEFKALGGKTALSTQLFEEPEDC